MESSQISNYYCNQFRQIYEGPVWFGESYLEKFRDTDEGMAFSKPSEKVHSIAELVSHCIYWRKSLINVMEGGAYTHTEEDKENWLPNETLKAGGWKELKEQLAETQQTIICLLQPMNAEDLSREYKEGRPVEELVTG